MNNGLKTTLVAVIAIGLPACPLAARAQQSVPDRVTATNDDVRHLMSELDLAKNKLARVQEQYKAGVVTQNELDDARLRVEATSRELDRAMREHKLTALQAAFLKRVDLRLDHAKVQEMARVLDKVAGMSVKVDPGVPADASAVLTMDAQGVPLATVLEAIADKADLMIAPDAGGIVLKKWPQFNGRVLHDPTAPWSSDWGVPPTIAMRGGGIGFPGGRAAEGGAVPGAGPRGEFDPFTNPGAGRGQNGTGVPGAGQGPGNFGNPGGDPRENPFGNPRPGAGQNPFDGPGSARGQNPFAGPGGMPGGPGMQPGSPFTVTSVGDRLVIAEPGFNDRGEPGLWMTAYLVDATGFHRTSGGFHPFTHRPAPNAGEGSRGNRLREGGPAPGAKPSGLRAPGAGAALSERR